MKKYKVYCLKNKANEIKYIGQTRQPLSRRYNGHKHSSWFKEEIFTIELVSDFDLPEPMFKLESMLIEQYNLLENGWNRARGYDEGKKEFDASKANNGFFGHSHLPDVCEKIGERSIGNSYAKGNKSRKGRNNSEYHNQRISETHEKRIMCIDTGEVFKSGREAAKHYDLQRSKISNVCHGKRKTTGGLRFCFVD